MADYIIQDSTLEDIADAIRAKTGGTSAMTPAQMVTEIASIPSGTTITDGIVVKARDANGYPTEIDLYASDGIVHNNQFRSGNQNNAIHPSGFYKVTKINAKNAITEVKQYAFAWLTSLVNFDFSTIQHLTGGCNFLGCAFVGNIILPNLVSCKGISAFSKCTSITGFDAPNLETSGGDDISQIVSACTSLISVNLPKATIFGMYNSGAFSRCTALTQCQLGSVGYGVTRIVSDTFNNCSQSGLTITIYTTGSYADTAVANTRNGATNATIIIKAAEDTTYNGQSFAAGDTILTSEVT